MGGREYHELISILKTRLEKEKKYFDLFCRRIEKDNIHYWCFDMTKIIGKYMFCVK